jgi:polar amino acid transport system substrate-binding protein
MLYMKNSIRLIALATSLALSSFASPANAGAVLDRVMEAKTLKVATDANWAPQSFLNEKNELDGFDVDVAKEIGKRLGAEVEFITPAWDIITAGNWSGRWDMHVGSMTPTKARAEMFSFPGIYYYTPAAVGVHKDSKAATLADLEGKVFGATTSSTYEAYIKKDLTIDAEGAPPFEYQLNPGEIRSYETSNTALDDLRLGDGVRLDAVVSSLLSFNEAEKAGYPIKVIGDPVFYEPLSVAIERGDDEFAAKIAEAVKAMHADGTLSKLSQKWYSVDRTTVN